MSQYNFIDIHETPDYTERLRTSFGGVDLDSIGFRTLTVTGRGLIAPALDIINKPHADGAWVDGAFYRGREIKVVGLVDTEMYSSLISEIKRGENELIFSDEEDWYWNAYLSQVSEPIDNNRFLKVQLTFYSASPYKISVEEELINLDGNVPSTIGVPVLPEEIRIASTENADQVVVTNVNTGRRFILNGNITSGNTVRVFFNPFSMIPDGVLSLDIMSDLGEFKVKSGDQLQSSVNGVTMIIRPRSL